MTAGATCDQQLGSRSYGHRLLLTKHNAQITLDAPGPKHMVYAATLNNLAGLYTSMGAYQKAEPLYQESQHIRLEALGPQHPDYGTSLNNLAGLYQAMGAYEKAEPLYQESRSARAGKPGR